MAIKISGTTVIDDSRNIQNIGVATATTFVGALTGTASSTTNIPNLTGAITSVGTATTLGSFTSSQLATALTDETGSGANVFATSPTLTTPVLGTPSSGTLTSCTGLPISGLTASTSTALGVGSIELGHASDTSITRVSAGLVAIEGVNIVTTSATQTLTNKTLTSPTLTTPVLGTPSSGTLSGCTGLPLTTGVTGTLPVANGGTGVTAASTGSGGVVLSTSPTLTTPVLGTPSSGTLSSCTVDGTDAVGFRNIPQNSQSAAYTLVLADNGKHIFHPVGDNNARTFTIPANSSVAYPIGTTLTFINMAAAAVTIAITTDTLTLSSAGTAGSRTLAQYGSATCIKITSTSWIISGSGLT